MKKFFLLIAAISISVMAMPQKGKVTSALSFIEQGQLDKAKEAIDQAKANEKTANWFNTYFAQGRLCQEVAKSTDPKFKDLCPGDPLQEAYTAYEKALSLDEKGALKKKIITGMVYNNLAVDLYNQGSKQFEEKKYDDALKSFETQIKITESDKYAGAIDTGMYYNAGLAAYNSGKYEDAIKYFQKCAELGYQGVNTYFQIYESYLGLKDTAKAEQTLLDLPGKFPNDKNVTLNLIDLYIKSNKYADALKYINKAKQDDPQNPVLYFAAGIIYLNQNNFDPAIEELTKSVEMKPDNYDAEYGLGAAYINKAADMYTKANEIMDVNKYTEAIEAANQVYAKALPYMEKAYELKPDDVYTMRQLQQLYYRLRMTDKYNAIKAKADAAEGKQ
ncbi:MAG TPA: tetratricopeptide repeat protein [Bacteroidales bacterium]|jgi:tetratricopeptide (TPR) repeat protein|nr:tetratricopeptide repeat protein [Bacteroidales bacterium]